jgi:hypothetical protein
MPHIYITDEAKGQLDELIIKEHRSLSKEVEFLIAARLSALSNVDNSTPENNNQDNNLTL